MHVCSKHMDRACQLTSLSIYDKIESRINQEPYAMRQPSKYTVTISYICEGNVGGVVAISNISATDVDSAVGEALRVCQLQLSHQIKDYDIIDIEEDMPRHLH